jgi:hypothetical protein
MISTAISFSGMWLHFRFAPPQNSDTGNIYCKTEEGFLILGPLIQLSIQYRVRYWGLLFADGVDCKMHRESAN